MTSRITERSVGTRRVEVRDGDGLVVAIFSLFGGAAGVAISINNLTGHVTLPLMTWDVRVMLEAMKELTDE